MKILVACEYSGRVRDAFRAKGHDAWSCDLRAADKPSPWHIRADVRTLLMPGWWDMLIGHPYCTFNCLSGVRWLYHPDDTHLPPSLRRRHPQYPNRMRDFEEGAEFFKTLQDAPVPRIALENSLPHGLAMQRFGRYAQKVQPWMFADPVTKAACLWLKGLPPLVPTYTHPSQLPLPIRAECHVSAPGPEREKERSRTRWSVALAMAAQWG